MLGPLRNFINMPWPEQRLFPEATLALAWSWYRVRTTRFGELQRQLAQWPLALADAPADERAARIGRVIRTASRHLPWECSCLIQALAARSMLRRRQLGCVLHIGVLKREDKLESHAWLSCGELILTGAVGHEHFTEMVRLT